MKIIDTSEKFLAALDSARHPGQSHYLALYSTWLGGIVTDPAWMVVALDDHMVHRGDGVFDVIKCVDGSLYMAGPHYRRFENSAKSLGIAPPPEFEQLEEIVLSLIRSTNKRNCIVHLYMSRGPGSLGVNPWESTAAQMMVLISGFEKPSDKVLAEGAKAITAKTPAKPAWLARIKSVDYLQNAMLQVEAEAAGVQYGLAFDGEGLLTEGPVVSVGIVTPDNRLLYPRPETVFPGITRARLEEIAQGLVAEGLIAQVGHADLTRDDLVNAKEILASGTITTLVSIVDLDGQAIGDGTPGPVRTRLRELLDRDTRENEKERTPVY